MADLVSVRKKINKMAELALSMLKTTFDGFMQHDLDILGSVLKDEEKLNEMERDLTTFLVEISKIGIAVTDKKRIQALTIIIAHLEEIGDYIKDMIERIEIKIQEKLLFSEEALSEYKHLYSVVEKALSDTVDLLKTNDKGLAKRILVDKESVDKLVERYRQAHTQRLMSGICDVRAGNMFLNLLDFTAQIVHHAQAVVENILSLR